MLKKMDIRSIGKTFPNFRKADTLQITERGRTIKTMNKSRVFTLSFDTDKKARAAIDSLRNIPGVLFAEPDYAEVTSSGMVTVSEQANDARVNEQWHLNNTGQSGGSFDADIDAFEAWNIFPGSSDSKIAIIDTGVDINQSDLSGKSTGDLPDPSVNGSGRLAYSHGTHVAGIAAAKIGDGDARGVNSNALIISKRIFAGLDGNNQALFTSYSNAHNKIMEAWNEGARVANHSYGGPDKNSILREAFAYGYKINRTNVVAMGNESNPNNISNKAYPAAFGQGVIAVGNTDHNDVISPDSRIGNHIDVVAPGGGLPGGPDEEGILSNWTFGNNQLVFSQGTSQAAPIVSGIATLLHDYSSVYLANDDIEHLIQLSAEDVNNDGFDIEYGHGRVNAQKALQRLQPPYTLTHYSWNSGGTVVNSSTDTRVFYGVPGLADGLYLTVRKEVRVTVTFPYMDEVHVWGRGVYSAGFSNENPNFGMGFCEAINVTNTSATLRTYVYDVYTNHRAYPLGYFPARPSNVQFAYTVHGIPGSTPPVEASITGPSSVPANSFNSWFGSATNGSSPYSYLWEKRYGPFGSWSQISTAQSVNLVETQSFDLRLTVTDALQDTDSAIKNVTVTGDCEPTLPCKVAGESLPADFALQPNYPNPFNPTTKLRFDLPEQAKVQLEVFNILGQKVATLVNETRQAGRFTVDFNGRNLSSGLYIARIQATATSSGQTFVTEMKMQLIK